VWVAESGGTVTAAGLGAFYAKHPAARQVISKGIREFCDRPQVRTMVTWTPGGVGGGSISTVGRVGNATRSGNLGESLMSPATRAMSQEATSYEDELSRRVQAGRSYPPQNPQQSSSFSKNIFSSFSSSSPSASKTAVFTPRTQGGETIGSDTMPTPKQQRTAVFSPPAPAVFSPPPGDGAAPSPIRFESTAAAGAAAK